MRTGISYALGVCLILFLDQIQTVRTWPVIPSGIRNGQVLRLKSKGFKEVNRYRTGDQYIRIVVDVPKNISKDLKKIILNLKENLKDEVEFKKINN